MPSAAVKVLTVCLKLLTLGLLSVLLGVAVSWPPATRHTEAQTPPVLVSDVFASFDGAMAPPPGFTLEALIAPTAVPTPVPPRTTGTTSVHIGPGEAYVVIGQLPRNGVVEAIGRDQQGKWLAIVYLPNSRLTGWIAADRVTGLTDIASLPVVPVTLLP